MIRRNFLLRVSNLLSSSLSPVLPSEAFAHFVYRVTKPSLHSPETANTIPARSPSPTPVQRTGVFLVIVSPSDSSVIVRLYKFFGRVGRFVSSRAVRVHT